MNAFTLSRRRDDMPAGAARLMVGWGTASLVFVATLFWPGSVRADCDVSFVDLPVIMSGPTPLIAAKINHVDVNLVLDSGAFFSMLTPAAAEQFKLPQRPRPDGLAVDGIGGRTSVSLTRVNEFTLTQTVIPKVEFLVGGNEPGANAVGLLGQNVLGMGDIEYDLGNGVVRMAFPGEGCAKHPLAYWAGSKPYLEIELDRPGRRRSKKTDSVARINGVQVHVEFDTGATTSVLSLQAAKRAGLVPGGDGMAPAGKGSGVGRKEVERWIATVRSFEIGAETIKNTPLNVIDMELRDVDMLLGIDFFLTHRIYVANGQKKIYFTDNAGPAFGLSGAGDGRPQAMPPGRAEAAPTDVPPAAPDDATGYARRGTALASRQDFEGALADLTRACELAPGVGKYFVLRGEVQLRLDHPFAAMADFNEALRLNPDDVDARLDRARLHIAGHDAKSARADLDAADKLVASQANVRVDIGRLYLRLDLLDAALRQFDLWLDAHDRDVNLKRVQNSRCWVRALMGKQLDQALDDCNAALTSEPESAEYLDSRGLVYLRTGELEKALHDYDAALRLEPKRAWSLYGRGITRLRTGAAETGNADIAAAKAILPSIVTDAKRYGIE